MDRRGLIGSGGLTLLMLADGTILLVVLNA